MKRRCNQCNKEFEVTDQNKWSCSELCINKTRVAYRKFYLRNKYKRLLEAHKYKQEHKRKINITRRRYYAKKIKTDICFKLQHLLRSRLYESLKGLLKVNTAKSLLGCTVKFLKSHLEKQFKEGMTWTNYSKQGWHIDHIIPCASFDLSKPEEQRKCFHYSNLQPLWAEENYRKAKKICPII